MHTSKRCRNRQQLHIYKYTFKCFIPITKSSIFLVPSTLISTASRNFSLNLTDATTLNTICAGVKGEWETVFVRNIPKYPHQLHSKCRFCALRWYSNRMHRNWLQSPLLWRIAPAMHFAIYRKPVMQSKNNNNMTELQRFVAWHSPLRRILPILRRIAPIARWLPNCFLPAPIGRCVWRETNAAISRREFFPGNLYRPLWRSPHLCRID